MSSKDATREDITRPSASSGMRTFLAILLAGLLAAGCVSKTPDTPVEAAALGPDAGTATEPTPATPAAKPTPTSPTPGAPAPAANASSSASAPAPETPPAAPSVDVLTWNGTFTGVGVSPPEGPVCCWWRPVAGESEGTFEVARTPVAILVELAWDDAVFDLELQLFAPDWEVVMVPDPADPALERGHSWRATEGLPGQPDAHARILVTEPEALALLGTYAWRVGAEGPAHEAAFRVAASVFYDAPPADGHSAFATPSDNP